MEFFVIMIIALLLGLIIGFIGGLMSWNVYVAYDDEMFKTIVELHEQHKNGGN